MVRTRKITKNADGSYSGVYGQGNANWVTGGDALAQIITHQLLTIKGELPTNENYGVSWFDHSNPQTDKVLKDTQIKRIINDNPYVYRILEYRSVVDLERNTMEVYVKIETTEGLLEINV